MWRGALARQMARTVIKVKAGPVAALIYGRDKHFINLFIWPANASRPIPPRASNHNGYHLVRWSADEMEFAAVSDLNEAELQEFARLWSAAPAR